MTETSSAASRSQTIFEHRAFTGALLIALLGLAALLRLLDLETNPPGMWQDEVSTGLDAYLIWTTGEDRAGDFLPLISRSFGDYPLAGYRYLAAPVLGLLGPTPGNERLVAAVFGTGMVLCTFWVVARRLGRGPGLAAMLSATLAPTWVHFSRYGSEAILLPAFLVLGWALIDEGRDPRRRWAIWLGAASLAATAYTYHAVKLVLPVWMIGFVVFQWPLVKSLWRSARVHLVGPAILFVALVGPSVQAALTTSGKARAQTVLAWYQYSGVQLWRTMLSNYLTYFDPGMLFVRGGPAVAQSIPGLGMWNMVELPLIIIALATLFRVPARRRFAGFVLFWFLLGPLPGGITYETHNMGRAIAWLPAPQILAGWGLWVSLKWAYARVAEADAQRRALGALTGLALLAAWGTTIYAVWWCTLVRYPKVTERDWQFEISRAMYCAREARIDERIVVSPRFQVANVFAKFHFAREDEAAGKPIWQMGERARVGAKEIYLFPARDRLPKGKEICRIVHGPTQKVYAYVFGPPEPEADETPAKPSRAAPPSVKGPRLRPKLDIGRPGLRTKPELKLGPAPEQK